MSSTFTNFSIMNLPEVSFIGGTYKELNYEVYDEAGNPVNISSYSFMWLLSPYGNPEAVALSKSGSFVSTSASNRFSVKLYSSDTVNLSGKYVQQPVIVVADGYEFRLGQGNVTIVPAVSGITASEATSLSTQIATIITSISASMVVTSAIITSISASMVVTSASANTAYTNSVTGWTPLSQSWYYASANSITIPGDYTALFKKGKKIRWTQSSTYRYGILATDSTYGGGNTTITLISNTDYPVLNTTITSPQISFQDSPLGFPDWFNYSVIWDAPSLAPFIGTGTLSGRFACQGRTCHVQIQMTAAANTTFGSGNWSIYLPVVASSQSLITDFIARARDSATANYAYFAFVSPSIQYINELIDASQNVNTVYWNSTYPFTWGNGDSFVITGRYEF